MKFIYKMSRFRAKGEAALRSPLLWPVHRTETLIRILCVGSQGIEAVGEQALRIDAKDLAAAVDAGMISSSSPGVRSLAAT